MKLDVRWDNFLKDNHHWYAIKATKKRIALIRIEVTNRESSDVQIVLGASKLTAGGNSYDAERPTVVIRKLSEFTWDFLLFSITDLFHPVTALMEGLVFLTGPLYNRRFETATRALVGWRDVHSTWGMQIRPACISRSFPEPRAADDLVSLRRW